MFRVSRDGKTYLESTEAGNQIATVLTKVPDLLKVIPHFLLDILSRYALNNPKNKIARNDTLKNQIKTSDLFPYWTLYKLMRSLGNKITEDELRIFVFKMHSSSEIQPTIEKILAYRGDLSKLEPGELRAK